MDELTVVKKLGIRKVGIQGAREQAKQATASLKPEECVNRFGIGFDDSGSMSGSAIEDAKKAVAAFLNNCVPQETSVALFLFSKVEETLYGLEPKINAEHQPLTCVYDLVNMYLGPIQATSGTPLFECMAEIMKLNITRGIVFSDGSPNYGGKVGKEAAISMAIEKKIPFDTVFIGASDNDLMKEIAEKTGGIYIHFTDSSVFGKQMKYLAPKYRALLANADLKARIERGETI